MQKPTPTFISDDILFDAGLSAGDLSGSLMATNGAKLLRYMHENNGVSLTKSLGGFHRKCVEWAADEFRWPGFEPELLYAVNKVLNEQDMFPLTLLHDYCLSSKLMRHRKGLAVLTKAGKALLDDHGNLQFLFAEKLLQAPCMDFLPSYVEPVMWDIPHVLTVIRDHLSEWTETGAFTELAVPVDLFRTSGPLGPHHEASLFVTSNLVRPLYWLGLLEIQEDGGRATLFRERRIRKSPLFDRFIYLKPAQGNRRGWLRAIN